MSNRRTYTSPFGDRNKRDSSGVLENDMKQNTDQAINSLIGSVAQIKEASMAIKNHMIDEEGLITDIDQGFTKN